MSYGEDWNTGGYAMKLAAKHTDLEKELLSALFDFISDSMCRQANVVERKMLAEGYAETGAKHGYLLRRLGLHPSQISDLDFRRLMQTKEPKS